MLAHLLRNLANNGEQLLNNGNSVANSDAVSDLLTNGQNVPRSFKQHLEVPPSWVPQVVEIQDRNATRQIKMNNFDLNDININSDDGTDVPVNMGIANSVDCPSWVQQQSSPPHVELHKKVESESKAWARGRLMHYIGRKN